MSEKIGIYLYLKKQISSVELDKRIYPGIEGIDWGIRLNKIPSGSPPPYLENYDTKWNQGFIQTDLTKFEISVQYYYSKQYKDALVIEFSSYDDVFYEKFAYLTNEKWDSLRRFLFQIYPELIGLVVTNGYFNTGLTWDDYSPEIYAGGVELNDEEIIFYWLNQS